MSNQEQCGDNRFQVIEAAKKDLLESTNIETSHAEMAVLNGFLSRCWQMGWLRQYEPPVPLTGDILNATFPDTRHGVYWCWDDRRSVETGEEWYEIRIERDSDNIIVGLRYVHELQALLDICGIKKKVAV